MAARRETAKHRAAFEQWYAANRDFRQASANLNIPFGTIRTWAVVYGWADRAGERDRQATRAVEAAAIERRRQMLEAQRVAGQMLRTAGMRFLRAKMQTPEGTPVETPKDAAACIKDGFALERQAEGLPDALIAILNMTDEQLLEHERNLRIDITAREDAPVPDHEGDT